MPDPGRAALAVRHAPVAGAPRVALVHGSMDRGQSFRKVERRLVDLDLTVYDRRGYGASSAAGTATSIAEHVEDLLVVLDGRPTVVVGHSLGAVVALAAAASRPGTVVAVMAYEAPLPWEPWWPRDSAGGRAVGAHLDDPPAAAEAFMRTMVGDRSWERLPASTRAARRAEGRALLAEMTAIRRPPAPLDLRRVAVPVLSARGAASAPHHRRAAEVVATGVAHGELAEIAGADHGAHLTHPDEFAALVRRTVAAVPGRRRSSP